MRYYIPEWDDKIDPNFDFQSDTHSPRHDANPKADSYMWQIFREDEIPFDGILISLMAIDGNNGKGQQIRDLGGFRQYLGLPNRVRILADCGAWGYIRRKTPPFDPVKVFELYANLGVQEAVTVDHLVLGGEAEARMKITRENGIRGYDAWRESWQNEFDLLVSTQGSSISDYLAMIRTYSQHGISQFALGSLARRKTSFIMELMSELAKVSKDLPTHPKRMHFFGLGRPNLFLGFQELENQGIQVSFDTASWLRRAWLNGHYYSVNQGRFRTYTAVRVEMTERNRGSFKGNRKLSERADYALLGNLEREARTGLREFGKKKESLDSISRKLKVFHSKIIEERMKRDIELGLDASQVQRNLKEHTRKEEVLRETYEKTLLDRPWEVCDCEICERLGMDVVVFRGNNRNRARGFHNVYTMYHRVLHEPSLWTQFSKSVEHTSVTSKDLVELSGRVLIITGCTKTKLGYDSGTRVRALDLYQGRIFKEVRNYARKKDFPLYVISAKYGLIESSRYIEGYEQVISTMRDVERVKTLVNPTLQRILSKYDKVLIVAGKKYREVLKDVWDDRFVYLKAAGYSDMAQQVRRATTGFESPKSDLLAFF